MQYPSCHHPAIPLYTQPGHPSIPLSAPGWSTVHFLQQSFSFSSNSF